MFLYIKLYDEEFNNLDFKLNIVILNKISNLTAKS